MIIQTKRLELLPLNAKQLELLITNLAELEKQLNFSYQAEPLNGFFLTILQKQLEAIKKDPNNYLWLTFWLIVRKSDRTVVGSADYKNLPDSRQEVEIGYGLGNAFEKNGYMTETVEAMCRFAFEQPGVSIVIAETEADNLASQRVLSRCGFERYKKDNGLWWKLTK